MSNTEYHNNLSKADLEYRLQKKGATKEEYIQFAETSVLEFTQEEKTLITEWMQKIEEIIVKQGYKLPEINTVNFVKTTMEEEGNAMAYTQFRFQKSKFDTFEADGYTITALRASRDINSSPVVCR